MAVKAKRVTKSEAGPEAALLQAFLLLKTEGEVKNFLTDLCTRKEIEDMAERWLIARKLAEGNISYREISKTTGASTTTIGRVARFLQQEDFGGYRLALSRLRGEPR